MSQFGTLVADERTNDSLDIKSNLERLGYAIPGLVSYREGFLSEHTGTRAKIQVMVVEDEGIVALDIRRNLQDLGYQVAGVASSGEQAIEKVAEERPKSGIDGHPPAGKTGRYRRCRPNPGSF